MSRLTVFIQGVGLLGPGLASWPSAQGMLRGDAPHVAAPTLLPLPARLPAAERRRAGAAIKLALAVADEAVAQSGLDPRQLATVFTSSSGEGTHCHALCETLASPHPVVSPTRFTNSVHNAAAGCWHIAVASQAASTSLCAFDASFAAGLLEAASVVRHTQQAVLLVASDSPYPEPLHSARPLQDHFAVALVLQPQATPTMLAGLCIEFARIDDPAAPSRCAGAGFESLRAGTPAAAALPLLEALARGAAGQRVRLELPPGAGVWVTLEPAVGPAPGPALEPTR